MFALPSPIPADVARLRAIVTDPASPRHLQRLAWAALKTDRGQPVRQARLAALAQGLDPADPPSLSLPPGHRAALRREMLARSGASRPDTGGDAA